MPPLSRCIASIGALLCAGAVALAAYASHAADAGDRTRLWLAAAFAFGHGAVVAVAAPGCTRRLATVSMAALVVGAVLFAGSLAGAALLGWSTRLAPAGGVLLIAGWLALAIDRARR